MHVGLINMFFFILQAPQLGKSPGIRRCTGAQCILQNAAMPSLVCSTNIIHQYRRQDELNATDQHSKTRRDPSE